MAYLFFAIFVCTVVGRIYYRLRHRPEWKPTNQEIALDMERRASLAVEAAREKFGITLDFTPESVMKVEEILGQIHQSRAMSDQEILREGLMWGAYVGEVIGRMKPVHWEIDSDVGGPGSLPIVFEDSRRQSFPVGWCRKRIKIGEEDNVWHKFDLLIIQDLDPTQMEGGVVIDGKQPGEQGTQSFQPDSE